MRIEQRGTAEEIQLVAETPEEMKALTDMWNYGVCRQAYDRDDGNRCARLIITPQLAASPERWTWWAV